MVMSTDTNDEEQQEVIETPEEEVGDVVELAAPDSDQAAAASPEVEVVTTESEPEVPDLDPAPEAHKEQQGRELEELHRMRAANAQKEWEGQQIRQAQAIERRALEQGADPQSAKQVARQHLTHQKALRDQDNKALDLIGFVEGRNNAAMHYAQKYKLIPKQAIEDIKTLIRHTSPQDMDVEAKRMAQLRSQTAEIQRLKQGSVKPQTFDNSQGSAEVTTNQDRLLDAYINGDRSEAAVKAAQRLATGS
jgi:hypothetical protein